VPEAVQNVSKWFNETALPRLRALPAGVRTALVVGLTALVVFALASGFSDSSGADYRPVYSNLTLEDAGLVTERLSSLQIPYRLGETGSAVLVPAPRVIEARLALAKDGLPRNRRSGLALLEKSGLGETQVVIDAKLLRAQEEEIETTLVGMLEVKDARVHLAIAPDVLFEEDKVPTTSAVMLTLVPGVRLAGERVDAIRRVVAAAVSGLSSEQVTVTDSLGRLLARGGRTDSEALLSDRRLKLQRDVETYLSDKTLRLLESALGQRHATVAVHATLDFDAVDREVTTYDPDRSSIRSEERKEQTEPQAGGASESSITNYELNSRVERVVSAPGSIERLSAAVFVEGNYIDSDEGPQYVPRSTEELKRIETMVRSALGVDEKRGDTVTVADQQFDRSMEREQRAALDRAERNDMIYTIALRLILLAGIVAAYRPIKRLLRLIPSVDSAFRSREIDQDAEGGGLEPAAIPLEEERRRQIHEEVTGLAVDSPENVAQLVRTWLAESAVKERR